jgi:hypothetical protein
MESEEGGEARIETLKQENGYNETEACDIF